MIYGGALADHLSLYHLSLPYLSFAFDNPFICGELFQRHRTAGVKFLCTDADFGTQPELRPVREGRWYVDIHTGGIHITAELFGMSFIIRYDAFAMLGAVFLDMCYGFADRLDGFDRHFVIQKFRSKIFFRSFFQ